MGMIWGSHMASDARLGNELFQIATQLTLCRAIIPMI